jgi:hypothetical protein
MEWQIAADANEALGTWFTMWIQGFVDVLYAILVAGVLSVAAVVLGVAWARPLARRRFRCSGADREVEVLFERRGLSRRIAGVVSCSGFEPGTRIACGRHCVDAGYRRQWKGALAPVGRRPAARAV